jgi:Uma2 family endonuclease
MNGQTWEIPAAVVPNYDQIEIEDGKPVDNIFVEKQLRLLTEALYSSWAGPGEGRPFQVFANVGLFYAAKKPPLSPDVMLSLDVEGNEDLSIRENRSYFIWEIGKPPDLVIEIVSDRRGGEASYKMQEYARAAVEYYIIFDPGCQLGPGPLRAFVRRNTKEFAPIDSALFPDVGLGLVLWEGQYENRQATWLRWRDAQGQLVPTGRERADQVQQRADQVQQRAERLAARLRSLGVDPDSPE